MRFRRQKPTVEQQLSAGQRTLASMRWKMGVSMSVLAFTLMLGVGFVHHSLLVEVSAATCVKNPLLYLRVLAISAMFFGGVVAFGLAPLVDDLRVMRFVMLVTSMAASTAAVTMDEYKLSGSVSPMSLVVVVLHNTIEFAFVIGLIRAMCSTIGSVMQARMWRTFRFWLAARSVLVAIWATLDSFTCMYFSYQFFWLPPQLLLMSFVSRPFLRQHCHAVLNRFFESRSEDRAAAGVAGLVGGCSAKEVVAQASARFRSLPLDRLSFEDLADNKPNPELFERTAPESLHECDAFLSHSWRDDPLAKWAALQRWRQAFVAKHGREPKVWLDKFCIDQRNIEPDLRCLPVFLSGCRRMVVLCGPSYLSRLWCIMELFTFVHMGRGTSKIDFEMVLREGFEEEDRSSVERAFAGFDAGQCSCFLDEDKARMLNIVHTAFGSLSAFNKAVQDVFGSACKQLWRACSCEEIAVGPAVSSNSTRSDGDFPDEEDPIGRTRC